MSNQIEYTKGIDFFGTKTRQIPSLTGSGAPTSTTAGAVGEFYLDILSKKSYKCVSDADGVYVWKLVMQEPEVSGIWHIVDKPILEAPCVSFIEDIKFESIGEDFATFEIEILEDEANILYYKQDDMICAYTNESGWDDINWQIIDFGLVPQKVSDIFYAWLIANAVPEKLRRPGEVVGYHSEKINKLDERIDGFSTNVAKAFGIAKKVDYAIPAELTHGVFFWNTTPDFSNYEMSIFNITCPFYIDHPDLGQVQCTKIEIDASEETITYIPSDVNMDPIVAYTGGEGQYDFWDCIYFQNTEDVPVAKDAWAFMVDNGSCDSTHSSPWFMLARKLNIDIPNQIDAKFEDVENRVSVVEKDCVTDTELSRILDNFVPGQTFGTYITEQESVDAEQNNKLTALENKNNQAQTELLTTTTIEADDISVITYDIAGNIATGDIIVNLAFPSTSTGIPQLNGYLRNQSTNSLARSFSAQVASGTRYITIRYTKRADGWYDVSWTNGSSIYAQPLYAMNREYLDYTDPTKYPAQFRLQCIGEGTIPVGTTIQIIGATTYGG